MSGNTATRLIQVAGEELRTEGSFFRIGKLPAEHFDSFEDPDVVLRELRAMRAGIDALTFLQGIADREPRHPFLLEWDTVAILPLSTYEQWWEGISCKTRNLVRKAEKKGVEIRRTVLDAGLVQGVAKLYHESPMRQGKRFLHYGKDVETIWADLATYPERSEFYGAYHHGELIGFIKFVEGKGFASLMHILGSLASRDLSPTNALLDRAVKLCTDRGIPLLHYGDWSLGGLGLFKRNHGFEPYRIPRYWVPLRWKGRLLLWAGLHRPLRDRVPPAWWNQAVKVRNQINSLRFRRKSPAMGR